MKKEVSPIVALVGILIALTAVQVLYWRGLMWEPPGVEAPMGRQEQFGPEQTAPAGLAEVSVRTVAGRPSSGYRDGQGDEALFDGPVGVAVDGRGTVYVVDSRNHSVRAVSPSGEVRTVAGAREEAGYVDGPAGEARFRAPAGAAVGRDGSVFVADTGNHRIRCLTREGVVSTYAGSETPPDDIGRQVGGYRDGSAAEAQFCYPVGVAVDGDGVVYVADAGNRAVRRIGTSGEVSTLPVAGEEGMTAPTQVALGEGDRIWVADTSGGKVWTGPRLGPLREWEGAGEATAGGPTAGGPTASGPTAPAGIAVVGEKSARPGVYVADAGSHCLWRLGAEGATLVAGQQEAGAPGWADGSGRGARFWSPAGLAGTPEGDLYVADYGNNCVRQVRFTARGEEAE